MKQVEATPQRPFYSVCYQYEQNPWTLYSCNRFDQSDRTMQGTDDFDLAKRIVQRCLTEAGISYAVVSKTTDCYNHDTVFEVHTKTTTTVNKGK